MSIDVEAPKLVLPFYKSGAGYAYSKDEAAIDAAKKAKRDEIVKKHPNIWTMFNWGLLRQEGTRQYREGWLAENFPPEISGDDIFDILNVDDGYGGSLTIGIDRKITKQTNTD